MLGVHLHHDSDPGRDAFGGDQVFFAEIWPDEGLDLVLGIFPRGGAVPGSTYLGLFTTFTASTVGTSGQTRTAYTEPSAGSYANMPIASTTATWGAIAAGTGGRTTTASQQTFPTATAVWGTVNGFLLKNSSTINAGVCYMACNFDDTTAVTINTNDVIKVTPTVQYNN